MAYALRPNSLCDTRTFNEVYPGKTEEGKGTPGRGASSLHPPWSTCTSLCVWLKGNYSDVLGESLSFTLRFTSEILCER